MPELAISSEKMHRYAGRLYAHQHIISTATVQFSCPNLLIYPLLVLREIQMRWIGFKDANQRANYEYNIWRYVPILYDAHSSQ